MEGKVWFFCLGLVLVSFAVAAVLSDANHETEDILVNINGYSMTFGEAIVGNFLFNKVPSDADSFTSSINFGHSADDIIVSVNDVTQTLQEAIDNGNDDNSGLCSDSASVPSGDLEVGHFGGNVKVGEDDDSLQDAINDGAFCYDYRDTGTCSTDCGEGTFNQERFYPDGTQDMDYYAPGGEDCYMTSGCSYKYVTIHTRTSDTSNQCTSVSYQKQWWWIKSGSSSWINPCTTKLGSGWEYSSRKVDSWTSNGYFLTSRGMSYLPYRGRFCEVTCRKKIPSVSTVIRTGKMSSQQEEQCLDWGAKTWWNIPACPSGYSRVEYQMREFARYQIRCGALCVRENRA